VSIRKWVVLSVVMFLLATSQLLLFAGVSKEVAAQYKQQYENKALFLRIPIRGEAETVLIRGNRIRLSSSADISGLRFRVGEQIRVTSVNFKDAHVEFKVSSLDQARQGSFIFQFRQSLTYSFPERPDFETALKWTFTEGLSYQEVDEAKKTFTKNQFDEHVREFISMAGVTQDFVMKAVAKRNPQFELIQGQLNKAVSDVASLKQQLRTEQDKNQNTSDEMRSLRNEINDLKNSNSSLTREKNNLSNTQNTLKSDINTLRSENQNYQTQLEDIAGKLNLETDSKSQLGLQVNSLSQRIEVLNRERDSLSSQAKKLKDDLASANEEKNKVSRDFQSSERRVQKLRSDLNALTSNRNSLESTFIRTKNAKESLELAEKLEQALDVRPHDQDMDGQTVRISDIWIQDHKIAQLEIQVPEGTGQPATVKLIVDSPDTVQFDDETRNLYQSIGEKFRLQPQWEPWSEDLELVLKDGEVVQSVGPREEAVWIWDTVGESDSAQNISFVAHLINEDDHQIFLSRQDFIMAPAGLISGLTSSFSFSSMIIGLLMGFVGVGVVVALKGSPRNESKKNPRTVRKQIRKEL